MSKIGDDGYKGKTDHDSGGFIVTEDSHSHIHNGIMFNADITDPDLDGSDELSIAFLTPDSNVEVHMFATASNTSASTFEMLKGPTLGASSGTNQVAINSNERSANTSVCKATKDGTVGSVTDNPSYSVDGSVRRTELVGVGKDKGASATRDNSERILARNTIYAFRLTGIDDNGNATINLVWYELDES